MEIDSLPESSAAERALERLSYLQTQQFRQLRFFSAIALGWVALIVLLLRLEGNPWLVFPLGLLTTLLSLTGWAIHRKLSFEVQTTKDVLQSTSSDRRGFERNDSFATLESIGFGGTYLIVALFGLYFAILPISHGNLPGWPPQAKPAEQMEIKAVTTTPGSGPAPYSGYLPLVYPAPMTPFPGAAYPRPAMNYPSNTMPLKPSVMTPLPRPFATPATARIFPPNPSAPAPGMSNSGPPAPPASTAGSPPVVIAPSAPKPATTTPPSSPAPKIEQTSVPATSSDTAPIPATTPVPARSTSPRPSTQKGPGTR